MKVQIGAKAAASFTLVTPIAPSRLEYSRSMTGRGGAVARVDAGTLLKVAATPSALPLSC